MICPYCNEELVSLPAVSEKVKCHGCDRDWGHSYCGVCHGNQYLTKSVPSEMSECKKCLIAAPDKWWRERIIDKADPPAREEV